MDDLKYVFASNLINLRTGAGMTQLELAEKLNYSDKSVSKWERADAVPDIYVLKKLSEIFNVSVDALLAPSGVWTPDYDEEIANHNHNTIILITMLGIWMLALLLFIIFWICEKFVWTVFVYAIPVSFITLLVLNSVWKKGRRNTLIIGLLVASVFLSVYCTFWSHHWWQIYLLLLPAEVMVFLSSRIEKRRK